MANTGYTSPFPTSHDTIGQSTLVTPLFMPSSPPQHLSSPTLESPPRADSPISDREEREQQKDQNHDSEDERDYEKELQKMSRPSTPGSPTGSALDARLAEYTLDFSQFPSGQFLDGGEEELLPELKDDEDNLSDVGGPEDFTENMEMYLMGGMSSVRKRGARETSAELGTPSQEHSLPSKQPIVEEDPDSVEYSEFGPPVDMSTPSHVLQGPSALAKDSTHLEGIEEDPADELDGPPSPLVRRSSKTPPGEAEKREEQLHERIAELEETLHDRDAQVERNYKRVLEAASAGEQIRHLQAELHRKTAHLLHIEALGQNEEALREQIATLQKQKGDDERSFQQSKTSDVDLHTLQGQIQSMQQELQKQRSQNSLDDERLETISHLRQQLQLTQDQLKKRDSTLEDTLVRLRDMTRAKETQLHEKNSEIDRLKAEMDEQALDNERLEMELDRVNTDYQALEDRLTSLESKNQPLEDLEEKNQSLEADLSRVQSQVEAQGSALKAAAADLPLASHSTYSEILDLIKDLGHTDTGFELESPTKDKFPEDQALGQPPLDLAKLKQDLQNTSDAQKAADAEAARLREQATETQKIGRAHV